MLRVQHLPIPRLPVPRAGENPQNQPAWSARPPALPFLPAPAQAEREVWTPCKCGPTRLGSRASRKLLETYRAAQPVCRPRHSADDYRAAGLAALCAGEHTHAVLQLSTALQLQLSSASKCQVLADRARALHRGGRSLAALDDLTAGLCLSPTALELYALRAEVLHGLQRHAAAAVEWRTVSKLTTDPWLRARAHGAAYGIAPPALPPPDTEGFQPTPSWSPGKSSSSVSSVTSQSWKRSSKTNDSR